MRIGLGSENQVLNGSSILTRLMLMVGAILYLPANLFLIQDTRRRNDREVGRSVLQEMLWEYIKW